MKKSHLKDKQEENWDYKVYEMNKKYGTREKPGVDMPVVPCLRHAVASNRINPAIPIKRNMHGIN